MANTGTNYTSIKQYEKIPGRSVDKQLRMSAPIKKSVTTLYWKK